jgi:hypothetical protein
METVTIVCGDLDDVDELENRLYDILQRVVNHMFKEYSETSEQNYKYYAYRTVTKDIRESFNHSTIQVFRIFLQKHKLINFDYEKNE